MGNRAPDSFFVFFVFFLDFTSRLAYNISTTNQEREEDEAMESNFRVLTKHRSKPSTRED